MRRGVIIACAFVVLAIVGGAGAVNEKDGSELNAFTKLARGSGPVDPGAKRGLTQSGPFSKQQITAYRCSSSGDPAISVDMSCNDPQPYGQDWNPDNEIAIAVDPEDPDHLLGGSNDYFYRFNNANGTRHVIVPTGFFTSFDGGATWVDGQVPFSSGNGAGDPSPGFVADPRSAAVNQPFALMGQLENVGPNTGCCVTQGNVTVSRSADGGLHWQRPVVVFRGHGAGIGFANRTVFYDKEWLTVDNYESSPFYGRIYVTSSRFVTGLHGAYIRSPIAISYSDDGGLTWSAPKVISGSNPSCTFQSDGRNETACDEDQFSYPEVASDGTVYVHFINEQNDAEWENSDADNPEFDEQIMVVKSTDGGVVFSDPVAAAQLEDGYDDTPWSVIGSQTVWGHQIRWASAGNISVNPNNPNDVTVVWSDRGTPNPAATTACFADAPGDAPDYDPCHAGPNADFNIYFSRSTNGGQTWTGRQLLSGMTGNAWFPWADHLPNGTLAVAWDQDNQAPPGDTFNHVLKVGAGVPHVLSPNTAEGRTPVENPDVSLTHWAGQYVTEDDWPRICGPAGYTDPPITDAEGKDCNVFHGDYTGLAGGSDGSINVTWTGLNRFDTSPQIDFYTGLPHDGYVQDAMFARR
jgi:BNR/Asp-box repeat